MGVRYPEHGVVAEAVPWAYHHAMFCRASGDQVARLAPCMCGGMPDGPVRVDRHTVGGICPGVGEVDGRGAPDPSGSTRPATRGATST